jgi:hypothetical protein
MQTKQSQFINSEIETKIDDLLAQMTLLEKAGQLTQPGLSIVGGFDFTALFEYQ